MLTESSDLIAEHHLPRSGIEQIVDETPLPLCESPPNTILLYWLAELTIRRLLNRVHYVMYDEKRKLLSSNHPAIGQGPINTDALFEPANAVMKVSAELNRQLDAWYNLLPATIRPDIGRPSEDNLGSTILLLRYYSAREIIYRPCVLYVSGLAQCELPDLLADYCGRCISSCRFYLTTVPRRLEKASASTEIVIHS